jgi:2-oxoglutarate-Fe(II)-dependent dioxygenase family protein
MKTILLEPVCSIEEANKPATTGGFAGRYLTRHNYDLRITEDATGTVGDERKFLFLRNALLPQGVQTAARILPRLKFNDVRNSHRSFLRKSVGGELVIGYLPYPVPRITRPTVQFPRAYTAVILPLCFGLQKLMARYWPDAWEGHGAAAASNGPFLIGSELCTFVADAVGVPPFSSATLNNRVLCPSHVDGRNSVGPACLTAFGQWTGAELCFPRLRVAFQLQPGDVLMADTVNEQHGNVGLLSGTRISVVAYLRKMT